MGFVSKKVTAYKVSKIYFFGVIYFSHTKTLLA